MNKLNLRLFLFVSLYLLTGNYLPLDAADNNTRSFKDVFPTISQEIIDTAKSESGYYNTIESTDSKGKYPFVILPSQTSGIHFNEIIAAKNPNVIVETLLFLPYKDKKITITDVYNAVINVRDLQGRKYRSDTRDKLVPLFDYVSRIESMKKKKEIDDPPHLEIYPEHEDVYIKAKEGIFGTSYYHNVVDANSVSLSCVLNNAAALDVLFIPVMKPENLEIHFYVEPVKDGVIMYAVTGVLMEKFAAKYVHIPTAIQKRFDVIRGWIVDGIYKSSEAQ
jgi:hypothetical protein